MDLIQTSIERSDNVDTSKQKIPWLENIILIAGGRQNLIDMIICESFEWFDSFEFNAARKRLMAKGLYTPDRVADFEPDMTAAIRDNLMKPREKGSRVGFEEDQVIINNWKYLSPTEIGRRIGRGPSTVKFRAFKLGIKRSKF
ncbi:hypothetical protein [Hufsiella ginkgonis]|uniref:Uncharacterized protein n=1 Tax=Hufsiella ginkgonis TaxID=2695274 RepID=A0A7K1Y0U8_9SPHI|nr:hypothetical protein [Hufsiella ginkgonis]MXV16851.1 hypothetical protein [Hufsiella ginkgonis]